MGKGHARAKFGARFFAGLLATAVLVGCGGGGEGTPATPAGTSAPPADIDEPKDNDDSATLDILSPHAPTPIKLDGKPIGETPIEGKKVSAGSHEVTFVFSEDDTPTLGVTVGPGESKTIKLDPAPKIQEGQGKEPPKDGKEGEPKPEPKPKPKK